MGGLQAQYAPSMYIGLWTRLGGFERGQLTRALERRAVIQGTLLRSTIHLVSRRDYWPLALAVRDGRRSWWLRTHRDSASARELQQAAEVLRRRLRDGPVRRAEAEQLVGKHLFAAVGLWLELVRVPPSGTWERRRADLFHLAEEWLGPPEVSADRAAEHLVRRYLGAFGPAPIADIAGWAGIATGEVAPAVKRLALRRFRGERGEELLDLRGRPLPDPGAPAPPRFLPTWDAILLVHARRTGILPEHHRERVFTPRNPQSTPTFLVDGAVAGAWRAEEGRIRLEPFGRLPAVARREAEEEAARLRDFHAG